MAERPSRTYKKIGGGGRNRTDSRAFRGHFRACLSALARVVGNAPTLTGSKPDQARLSAPRLFGIPCRLRTHHVKFWRLGLRTSARDMEPHQAADVSVIPSGALFGGRQWSRTTSAVKQNRVFKARRRTNPPALPSGGKRRIRTLTACAIRLGSNRR